MSGMLAGRRENISEGIANVTNHDTIATEISALYDEANKIPNSFLRHLIIIISYYRCL